MQTKLLPDLLEPSFSARAETILRKCVHCGFCTATCPTYQLLGNELDGPRGRIYQVKQLLEGLPTDSETLLHLDRCLTCRSCETTCPSGVNYAELIDIGRLVAERMHPRTGMEKLQRKALGWLLPRASLNRPFFKLSSLLRPLLPGELKRKTPRIRRLSRFERRAQEPSKTVLLLDGCVQSTLSPNTNAAAEAVLTALGYRVLREPQASCCGAVNHHLSQTHAAEQLVLQNLANWKKMDQERGIDYVVSTASGCGAMLKDYPVLLQHIDGVQGQYDDIVRKICDISELFSAAEWQQRQKDFRASSKPVAFHAPCTLTHGQKLSAHLFNELSSIGYNLQQPVDAHLCCGSAGTYSVLQPDISRRLRANKLDALTHASPDLIVTANVGCEHHLGGASDVPVIHWVELVAGDLR